MLYDGKKIIKINPISDYAMVDLVLGNYCNYSCSYCFPGANTGDLRFPRLNEVIKRNLLHIINQIEKPRIDFIISGGEPTLYNDFEEIVSFLGQFGKITVITNGSRTIRWWKESINLLDRVKISYHTEEGDLDHIKNLIQVIKDNKKAFFVNVMVNPRLLDKAISAYENLVDTYGYRDIALSLIRSHSTQHTTYTEEQNQILNSTKQLHGLDAGQNEKFSDLLFPTLELEDGSSVNFKSDILNKFSGDFFNYSCSTFKTFLQINYRGEIGKMSCGQTYTNIGNIFDKDFYLKFNVPNDHIICKILNKNCGCLGLIGGEKWIQDMLK